MDLAATYRRFQPWLAKPFFSGRELLFALLSFFVVVLLLNRALFLFDAHIYSFDYSPTWPLAGDPLAPPAYGYPLAVLSCAIFALLAQPLSRGRGSLPLALFGGIALVALTNLFHGVHVGYFTPIATNPADGVEYWHDAVKLQSASAFLGAFNELQPGLFTHSQTHPPGAVLVFYGMHRLGLPPELMSIAILLVGGTVGGYFVYRLVLRLGGDPALARFVAFLYLVLPSTQIYYLATLDALIAASMTGALLCFLSRGRTLAVVGAAAFILLTASLTFGFVFLFPVLALYDYFQNRRIARVAVVASIVVAVLSSVPWLAGFDYAAAFRTASALENPRGPLFMDRPLSYATTRLENVGDILVLFGPLCVILCMRGFSQFDARSRELRIVAAAGVGTLIAMFVTGAFRCGETARACAFVYPYLLLPLAAHIGAHRLGSTERLSLAGVTFAQSVAMQLFGHFLW